MPQNSASKESSRQGLALLEEWEGAGALGLPCKATLSRAYLYHSPHHSVFHTGPLSMTSLGLSDGSADKGAVPKFEHLSSYPRTHKAGGNSSHQLSPDLHTCNMERADTVTINVKTLRT